MKGLLLIVLVVQVVLQRTSVSGWVMPSLAPTRSIFSALHAKQTKKLSMAEKRKRRAQKHSPQPVTGKPVDFSSKAEPQEKKKGLSEEQQRKSVGLLTCVKERVEHLPAKEIKDALASKGYYVVDRFLDNQEVVSEVQEEGQTMLKNGHMEKDPGTSGKYVLSLCTAVC